MYLSEALNFFFFFHITYLSVICIWSCFPHWSCSFCAFTFISHFVPKIYTIWLLAQFCKEKSSLIYDFNFCTCDFYLLTYQLSPLDGLEAVCWIQSVCAYVSLFFRQLQVKMQESIGWEEISYQLFSCRPRKHHIVNHQLFLLHMLKILYHTQLFMWECKLGLHGCPKKEISSFPNALFGLITSLVMFL